MGIHSIKAKGLLLFFLFLTVCSGLGYVVVDTLSIYTAKVNKASIANRLIKLTHKAHLSEIKFIYSYDQHQVALVRRYLSKIMGSVPAGRHLHYQKIWRYWAWIEHLQTVGETNGR